MPVGPAPHVRIDPLKDVGHRVVIGSADRAHLPWVTEAKTRGNGHSGQVGSENGRETGGSGPESGSPGTNS
jgi:hypothetical protein